MSSESLTLPSPTFSCDQAVVIATVGFTPYFVDATGNDHTSFSWKEKDCNNEKKSKSITLPPVHKLLMFTSAPRIPLSPSIVLTICATSPLGCDIRRSNISYSEE